MFMITLKPTVKKIVIVGCVVILCAITAVCCFGGNKDQSTQSDVAVQNQYSGDDNASRIAYLNQFGWDVSKEPIEVCNVRIPKQFDDTFNEFNEIQKSQGFNLEDYKGEICKRYSYQVTNYEDKPDNVYADLLVMDGNIIAGDICSSEFTGFIQGLQKN